MKKYIILYIIVLSTLFVNASDKPNGYLGKSVFIGYNAKVSHPIVYGTKYLFPELNNQLIFNYALSDKMGVEASLNYSFLSYNKPYNSYYYEEDVLKYSCHGFGIDVSYKYYPVTGHFSPMGFYFGFGLTLNSMLYSRTNGNAFISNKVSVSKFMIPGVKYVIGRNYMLSNRLLLNIGMEMQFNIGAFIGRNMPRNEKESYDIQNAKEEIFRRMTNTNGIGLVIGFGYLVK